MHYRTTPAFSIATLLYLAWLVEYGLATDVTWIKPSNGDDYASGETIVGQWSADKQVVSPSFKLCIVSSDARKRSEDDVDGGGDSSSAGDKGGTCGTSVWPTIQKSDSDGSYTIHM